MAVEKLLRRIRLGPTHQRTGRTRHCIGGGLAPAPVELRIVRYDGEPSSGFLLLGCDESGVELTDTHHEPIEKSMSQAEWEFGVRADEWEIVEA